MVAHFGRIRSASPGGSGSGVPGQPPIAMIRRTRTRELVSGVVGTLLGLAGLAYATFGPIYTAVHRFHEEPAQRVAERDRFAGAAVGRCRGSGLHHRRSRRLLPCRATSRYRVGGPDCLGAFHVDVRSRGTREHRPVRGSGLRRANRVGPLWSQVGSARLIEVTREHAQAPYIDRSAALDPKEGFSTGQVGRLGHTDRQGWGLVNVLTWWYAAGVVSAGGMR